MVSECWNMTSPGEADRPPARVRLRSVRAPDVGSIRRRLADVAAGAGVPAERVAPFILAVNEIVINAIQHGGGIADVVIAANGDRLEVEVRDYGDGIPPDVPTELPPLDQSHGRGLWLARQLCPAVKVRPAGSLGTIVELAWPIHP
jgi:serine/threonine-protein kinase RsbW